MNRRRNYWTDLDYQRSAQAQTDAIAMVFAVAVIVVALVLGAIADAPILK